MICFRHVTVIYATPRQFQRLRYAAATLDKRHATRAAYAAAMH